MSCIGADASTGTHTRLGSLQRGRAHALFLHCQAKRFIRPPSCSLSSQCHSSSTTTCVPNHKKTSAPSTQVYKAAWSQPLTALPLTSWKISYTPSWIGMPQLYSAMTVPAVQCCHFAATCHVGTARWEAANSYAPNWLPTNRFWMLWSIRSLALLLMLKLFSIAQRSLCPPHAKN